MNRKLIIIKSRMRSIIATILYIANNFFLFRSIDNASGKTKVILFHHLDNKIRFRNILKKLKKKYNIVSFESYLKGDVDRNKLNIIIALDDGYRSWYEVGLPLFKEFSVKPLLFISSSFIGLSSSSSANFCKKYIHTWSEASLKWDEVKELSRYGATIGGHCLKHEKLSNIDDFESITYAVGADKQNICKNLELPVTCFAYPFGLYDRESCELVKSVGYQYAFTCDAGYLDDSADNFRLKRNNIGLRHPLTVCAEIEGWSEFVTLTIGRLRGWLRIT